MNTRTRLLLMVLMSFSTAVLAVSDGLADPSFSTTGLKTEFSQQAAMVGAMRRRDGKIWVVGMQRFDLEYPFGRVTLMRLSADGTDDPAYSPSSLSFGNHSATKVRAALLPDDGLIVATEYIYNNFHFHEPVTVCRLSPEGAFVSAFGAQGGCTEINFQQANDYSVLTDVFVDAESRVLVLGSEYYADQSTILRLDSGGLVDTTFANNGRFVDDCGDTTISCSASDVAFDRSGRIVVASTLFVSASDSDMQTLVLDPDGTVSPWFGNDGRVVTAFDLAKSQPDDRAYGVTVGPGGNIAIAGSAKFDIDTSRAAVAVIDPYGDEVWRWTGSIGLPSSDVNSWAGAATFDPVGRLIVAGTTWSTFSQRDVIAVTRHLVGGGIDPDFGTAGATTFDVNASSPRVVKITLDANRPLLSISYYLTSPWFRMAVARLTSDLLLVSSFE